ncbi:hypothetical protein HGG65_09695 [Alteromonadaceae bacterium A_SAG4]|uniref:alginate O-acetyltransferase AlgX-related protein n=1 Tax=Alteromonas sp. AO-Serp TaxID=2804349 RepID=UPI001446F806|nr:hypothetical protein [Alteromonas sp. AO-Serp]NKW89883.1 hypothetical protein [Alteromonadaceae bacterium A_SAG4]NKX34411.1 hypothetical protein [Alteromonadaceae bacterium A_SAG3]
MASFTIKETILSPTTADGIIRWCVDEPFGNTTVDDLDIEKKGLRVSGWLLAEKNKPFQMVIIQNNSIIPLETNVERPDVIEKVLQKSSSGHEDVLCGFNSFVKLSSPYFQVGVIQQGRYQALVEYRVEGALKVIEGDRNWLFLDNDSNNSVEQYTGRLKLTRKERTYWKEYFQELVQYKESLGIHICMLIAPSKEMVYSEYYPHKRAKVTPIDQLEKLAPESFDLIIPIQELRNSDKRSYRVCDTHWSHYGAMCASIAVLSRQNKNIQAIEKLFSSDIYRTRHVTGDLGNKVFPPQKHDEEFLGSFNHQHFIVFDNQLPNFGRIRIIYYDDAMYDEVLLILGSSSSYTMFNYLSRVYKTVVFVHCAGNVDPSFIKRIKPDFIVSQSNARFIVRPPSAREDYTSFVREKAMLQQNKKIAPTVIKSDVVKESCHKNLKRIVGHISKLNNDAIASIPF